MKALTTLTAIFLLFIALGSFAADNPTIPKIDPTPKLNHLFLPSMGITPLRIDPMLEEIDIIMKTMQVREEILLTSLQESQTELDSERIIQQIIQLDREWELSILKIQLHHAQLHGYFALEREIQDLIDSVISTDIAVLP